MHFKIVSEYDQETSQSQAADKSVAPRGRATQQSQDTRKINEARNQLSFSHQDDCNTILYTK